MYSIHLNFLIILHLTSVGSFIHTEDSVYSIRECLVHCMMVELLLSMLNLKQELNMVADAQCNI